MFMNNVGGFYGTTPMWGQTFLGNQVPYTLGWNQIPFSVYGYGNTVPFTGQHMLNVPFGAQQIGGFNTGIVPNYNPVQLTNPFVGHTGFQTQGIGRGLLPIVGNLGNPFIGCC